MTPMDRESSMMALVRTLPYVRLYQGKTFVVKLGGSLNHDPAALRATIEQVGTLLGFGIRVILVHGGGPQATALAEKLGISTPFVDGRRVTSKDALGAVVMAINGTVSTQILAECRRAGVPAIGLSGVDAALIKARHRPPVTRTTPEGEINVDYGEVGYVASVQADVLERLIGAGFTPVVSPVAADDAGRVLNINADTVAATIAAAVGATKLLFLTDAPGILGDRADPGSLISYVDLAGLERLEASGAVAGGMLPKVNAARAALAAGVPRVHIVGHGGKGALLAEVFTNEGAGTLIVRDTSELQPSELVEG